MDPSLNSQIQHMAVATAQMFPCFYSALNQTKSALRTNSGLTPLSSEYSNIVFTERMSSLLMQAPLRAIVPKHFMTISTQCQWQTSEDVYR